MLYRKIRIYVFKLYVVCNHIALNQISAQLLVFTMYNIVQN